MITDGLAVRFRQIRYESDVEALLENEKQSLIPWTRKRFEMHREKGGYCLLAVHPADPHRVIGHMLYGRFGNSTTVYKFVVRPGYRKQGVGGRMLRRLINKGGLITINVWERDVAMQKFLHNRGFVYEGTLSNWYWKQTPHSAAYIFTFGE